MTVKLDRTAPAVTGTVSKGTRGTNGWYVGPVTVHFACTDALSGVAVCPDDVILTSSGTVTRTAADKAGNVGTATVAGITIDQVKPALTTADVNVQGGIYQLGAAPAATCTARDTGSGPASCVVTVSAGTVGTITWTATATDKAGNKATATGTYRVVYRFDGFVQPVNDTARVVGATTSVFKAATTVPVKFQLKRSNGTLVTSGVAPAWAGPVKGGYACAPVNETVSTATPDTGTTYRAETPAGQYGYNWKAPAGSSLWRLGVTLNDGQSYYVTISVR